ncbi:hypothetical protein Srufu_008170 [Streptomyces libani subsp. rufus]|nr:hypothetical protein Srufu_008170 [Streptomyces libani subsp. rufus]
MNGITAILAALHDGEYKLAGQLLDLVQRHPAETEVHHVARYLARWSYASGDRIRAMGPRYGLPDAERPSHRSDRARHTAASVPEGQDIGLVLLRELSEVHLAAARNSLYWDMLTQATQANRDDRLLELASACQPYTRRQMRWTHTVLKELSPQLLTGVSSAWCS